MSVPPTPDRTRIARGDFPAVVSSRRKAAAPHLDPAKAKIEREWKLTRRIIEILAETHVSVLPGAFFAFLAGYWAGKCAQRRSLVASIWVAGLIAAGATISLINEAHWSQVAALLLMAPAALVGGHLRLQQLRRRNS